MTLRTLRRVALAAVLCVAIGAVASGCASTLTDAATLNFTNGGGAKTAHVDRAEYQQQLRELVGSKQFQELVAAGGFAPVGDNKNTTNADIAAIYLQQMIGSAVLDAEFNAHHLPKPNADQLAAAEKEQRQAFALPDEVQQDAQGNQTFVGQGAVFSSFPKHLRDALIQRQARSDAVVAYYRDSTPEKEKAFYDEFGKDLCPTGRVVSHILLKDEATAKAVLGQMDATLPPRTSPEYDAALRSEFATFAQQKSTDNSAQNGMLGCLAPGAFVKDFEDAAMGAPNGVVVGPVHTQFGYHLILVEPASFDTLGPTLASQIQNGAAIDLRERGMHVWIDPRYGTGSLTADPQTQQVRFTVTPPNAPAPRDQREKPHATTTTTLPGLSGG
jgi:parvulin-like peptidyl-prolyl isomerase